MATALLSSAYFGPIQWYQKLNRFDYCIIEQNDNFIKQTYRNRCIIPTTNGLQILTVPIERIEGTRLDKTLMKDIRISDHGSWRHLHWTALMSAYGESPFFEYYQDDIRPFFEKKWEFLIDFNEEITSKMCELLDIRPTIKLSDHFIGNAESLKDNDVSDYRDVIRPKHPGEDSSFQSKKYYQVYDRKIGFQSNMSILDLLFNNGNESIFYL